MNSVSLFDLWKQMHMPSDFMLLALLLLEKDTG
jgi:hypothetical protein